MQTNNIESLTRTNTLLSLLLPTREHFRCEKGSLEMDPNPYKLQRFTDAHELTASLVLQMVRSSPSVTRVIIPVEVL